MHSGLYDRSASQRYQFFLLYFPFQLESRSRFGRQSLRHSGWVNARSLMAAGLPMSPQTHRELGLGLAPHSPCGGDAPTQPCYNVLAISALSPSRAK